MKLRSALLASAFGLTVAFVAAQASAVTVTGTSGGAFSSLNNCNVSQDCRIVNTGNGDNTQVQWGSTSFSAGFVNPSTLTSINMPINTATNANDVTIARLEWFNGSTEPDETPDAFSFTWTLTISFTAPNGSIDTEPFTLSVSNPPGPGDVISGFTLTDLSNLSFALNGLTVDDFKYSVADGAGTCDGTNTGITDATWFNCENNIASLIITADFTEVIEPEVILPGVTQPIPEPATLALLGMGLLGLGAVRRRKAA